MKRIFVSLAILLVFSLCFVSCDDFKTVFDEVKTDEPTSKPTQKPVYQETNVYKPVIYLYPESDTVCSVSLDVNGELVCTYPDYADGWNNFTASPDGTLTFANGKEYYCLYWEAKMNITPDLSQGFCVKGSESAEFLENALADIGLNSREANEFIIYWLPILEANEYNVITFQTDAYTDAAKLNVTPAPDSMLRVYMYAYASDEYVDIAPQSFESFVRDGFAVVEWGGTVEKIK